MPAQKEISGNTLRVYLYLATHGPSELRDVQRGLGLSTPSLASYHLNRLTEQGYVAQDQEGRYLSIKESSVNVLQDYSKVGTSLVPNLLFFTLLFTILIPFFSYMTITSTGFTVYLIAASAAMVAVLWYETLCLWRRIVVEPPE